MHHVGAQVGDVEAITHMKPVSNNLIREGIQHMIMLQTHRDRFTVQHGEDEIPSFEVVI